MIDTSAYKMHFEMVENILEKWERQVFFVIHNLTLIT